MIDTPERRRDYLNTTAESLETAESRIKDINIVKAIMEYTKTQILLKVSYILLAQNNENRQNIIDLLFGNLNKNQ